MIRTVGAQCGGTNDSTKESGAFGGIFACVLAPDSRQGRPVSWDTLVVALVKLVCKLVQTPLPSVRLSIIYLSIFFLQTFT